jgi:hypothetical protein
MSPHLCYPPYSFTGAGGSRKLASHDKDKLLFNPATGRVAQKSVINQQARDAKKLKTRLAEEERAEVAKKAKFDSLVTLEGLSASDFVEMRKRNMYEPAHNSRDQCFYQKEQELIMKEFMPLSRNTRFALTLLWTSLILQSIVLILGRPYGSLASLVSILS